MRAGLSAERAAGAAAVAAAAAYFFHLLEWASAVEPGIENKLTAWAAAAAVPVILGFVIRLGNASFRERPGPDERTGTSASVLAQAIPAAALVSIPVLFLYLPTIDGSFLGDDWLILMLIKRIGAGSSGGILANYYEERGFWHSNIRFTNHLAWWVNYRLGGHDPTGYHLLNITVHLLNCFLVALAAGRLSGKREAGFWAAAFFGLHPLMAEPVSWLYGRSDLLYTFFFLASFLLLLKFKTTGRPLTFLVLLIAVALAHVSKEFSLVLVPFLLFTDLILFFVRGTGKKIAHLLLRWIPLLLVTTAYIAGRKLLLPGADGTIEDRFSVFYGEMLVRGDLFSRFAGDIPAYILFPVAGGHLISGLAFTAGALLLGLIVASLVFRSRRASGDTHLFIIGAAWFVIALAPGLERLAYTTDLPDARYFYSAIPGAALFFGFAITPGGARSGTGKYYSALLSLRRALALLLLVLYLPLSASGVALWDGAMNAETEFFAQADRKLPSSWKGEKPDTPPEADLHIISYPRMEEWWRDEGIHVAGYPWTRAPFNLYYRYYMTFPVDIFRIEGGSGWRDPFHPDVYRWFNPDLADYQAPTPLDAAALCRDETDLLFLWRRDTGEFSDVKQMLAANMEGSGSTRDDGFAGATAEGEAASLLIYPSGWSEFTFFRDDNDAVGKIFEAGPEVPPGGEAWNPPGAWPPGGVLLRAVFARNQLACAFSFPPTPAHRIRSLVISTRLAPGCVPLEHPIAGHLELRTKWGPWSLHSTFSTTPAAASTILEIPLENHVPLLLSRELSDLAIFFTPGDNTAFPELYIEEVKIRLVPNRAGD